jgi:hypothetical protein
MHHKLGGKYYRVSPTQFQECIVSMFRVEGSAKQEMSNNWAASSFIKRN